LNQQRKKIAAACKQVTKLAAKQTVKNGKHPALEETTEPEILPAV